MRTLSPTARRKGHARRHLSTPRLLGAAGALSVVALCAPATAVATPLPPPRYSLSIEEGETTLPENNIQGTSAHVRPHAQIRVSIVHAGQVVAQDTENGDAGFSQVPQVGDLVTVESPVGTTIASIAYDGLPSLDPTVCAGSRNFSGQRSAGQTVEGSYYTVANPYSWEQKSAGQAQVTLLSGSSYAGNFLVPLALGQTATAKESLETPLGGGPVFTYSSETVRPVGACPLPPPPPPPPPQPAPGLQGAIAKVLTTTIRSLLKHGWSDRVTINQPGTVTQDLYLENGTLPASASRRRHKPPALLLASGSSTAHSAGTVTIVLKLTSRGRGRLRHAHRVRVALLTTLHTAAGAKVNLPRRSITLRR